MRSSSSLISLFWSFVNNTRVEFMEPRPDLPGLNLPPAVGVHPLGKKDRPSQLLRRPEPAQWADTKPSTAALVCPRSATPAVRPTPAIRPTATSNAAVCYVRFTSRLLKTRKLSHRENLVFARGASLRPIVLTLGHRGGSLAAKRVGPPNQKEFFVEAAGAGRAPIADLVAAKLLVEAMFQCDVEIDIGRQFKI